MSDAGDLARAHARIAELEAELKQERSDRRDVERTHERRLERLDGHALAMIRARAELAAVGQRYRADFDLRALEDVTALLEMLDLLVGDPW